MQLPIKKKCPQVSDAITIAESQPQGHYIPLILTMSLTFNLLRCEFIRLQYKKIRHMVYVREYMYIAYTDLYFFLVVNIL